MAYIIGLHISLYAIIPGNARPGVPGKSLDVPTLPNLTGFTEKNHKIHRGGREVSRRTPKEARESVLSG
jgi:hypothetical protein